MAGGEPTSARRRFPWITLLALLATALIAIGVYAGVAQRAQESKAQDQLSAAAHKAPEAQWVLAEGTDKGLVQSYCTACHSLAPIVTHSGFTEQQWQDTVDKMRNSYGAPIDDPTAERIVAYLQEHYSTDTTAPAGTRDLLYNDPVDDGRR